MSRRSPVVVSLALLGLAVLGGAGTAFAHDPIILTDTQTSPDAGPLLPDGTISFALYGTLNSAGDTRGLRVHFDSGDSVDITLSIPDRSPENELPKRNKAKLESLKMKEMMRQKQADEMKQE